MMWSSSAIRSGGNDERDMAADGLLGRVTEQPLGAGVPALNDAVERLADDGIVGRFDDRREQPGGEQLARPFALTRRCALTSLKISTHPETAPSSSRIGAALSSIAHSPPSFRISTVWFASPTTTPSRSALVAGFVDRLAGVLVDDAKHGVERLAERFAVRPAGQRFRHGVHVGDAAIDVGGDDRVADAVQRDAQHFAPLAGADLRGRTPRRIR